MTIEAAITFDDLKAAAAMLQTASSANVRRVGERMQGWLRGEFDAIDQALGLAAPGHHKVATRRAMVERDRLVRQLAAEHFNGLRATAAAAAVEAVLARYASSAWARERGSAICPVRHVGTPYAAAWAILQARDRLLSARQVRRILAISSDEMARFQE